MTQQTIYITTDTQESSGEAEPGPIEETSTQDTPIVQSGEEGAVASREITQGEYCVVIKEPGDAYWKIGLRAFNIPLQVGQTYALTWSSQGLRM